MSDRATHIVLLAVMLAFVGMLIDWAPKLYAKWQPESSVDLAAHRIVGWLGRHFWHIWAVVVIVGVITGLLYATNLLR